MGTLPYIGNSNTKELHIKAHEKGDCNTDRIAPENRREFETMEEAINEGYSPCGNCFGDWSRE